MPIKRVQFPDGSIKRVEVPEGATNEQIIEFVASQYQPQAESYADKQKRAEQVYGRVDPTEGMSGGERFMAGVGKSLFDTGRGVKQLFGGMSREEVDEQRRVDAPLMKTRAGMGGNIAGTVGQILTPGGAAIRYGSMAPKAAAAVRGATLPTSLRGMTVQGAAIGGTQQVGSGDSRLAQMLLGAGAGAAGGAVPKGLGALYRGTGSYIGKVTPQGAERRAINIIRGEAEKPSALMRPQPSQIPGVQRTLAEETLDPGIARLERNARSTSRGFDHLDRTNNAARVSAIRAFAGDESAIAAAKQQRDAVAIPALERAQQVKGIDTAPLLMEVDDMIQSYTGNPAVQDGLKAARREIEASGGDMRYMENARQYIGRLIGGTANNNGAKLHELMDVKDSLVNTMGAASPDFSTYLNAYAQGSKPVNRMQIGQSLLNSRSGSAILDPVTGEQVLTPAAFSGRARNLDKVAQEATQFKRARAADYLEPSDFATIRNVQDDLERRAFAATAGSGGNSQTFERMALNDRVAGGLVGRIPIIGRVAEYLGQIGETRLQAKLAELLADPVRFREGLARLPANDRRIIENAIARVGGSAGAMSPALTE